MNRSTSSCEFPDNCPARCGEWTTNSLCTLKKLVESIANLQQDYHKTSVRRALSVKTSDKTHLQLSPGTRMHRSHHTSSRRLIRNHSPTDGCKSTQIRLENKRVTDTRRWSMTSLPSSGYGTLTPASSNLSSEYSSKENLLHHKNHGPTQPRSPLCGGLNTNASPFASRSISQTQSTLQCATDQKCMSGNNTRSASPNDKANISGGSRFHRDSISDAQSPARQLILSLKPRSLSLSSPCRSPGGYEQDILILNHVYKERFPRATMQMRDRLQYMLQELETENTVSWEPISRLVHTQIIKHITGILNMTNMEAITSAYFFELTQNLEKLLKETRVKCPESLIRVSPLVQQLLFIIARPARLLECIEFDPQEFYKLLEVAEDNLRNVQTNVPKYIISKLGLDKDPYDIGSEELTNSFELNCSLEHSPSPFKEMKNSENNAIKLNITNESSPLSETGVAKITPKESDFEDIKLISNGAYGTVHLVRENKTRKRFAMKKIRKDNLLLRNKVDQIFAERDIMAFADSPFVVGLYCTFETKKYLCMIMEYVEGGDVATLIKNIGALPDDLARMYFAETVLALEYLHNFGIVHRDLKPDNLLITLEGHIKLTDFGLSKIGLMTLTTTLYESLLDKDGTMFQDKQVFGTPDYIAPEVILRQGYDRMVDWWAMGIILYEFVVGCTPFDGDCTEELFGQIINGAIDWPQEPDPVVPEDIHSLITELLQRDPLVRLGAGGTLEVKEHCFFTGLDWQGLMRQKATFIPVLDHEEDTSYFDPRTNRYQHESESDDGDRDDDSEITEHYWSSEDSQNCVGAFHSFSSCSSRFSQFVETSGGRLSESSSLVFPTDSGLSPVSKMARSVSAAPTFLACESSASEDSSCRVTAIHASSSSSLELSAHGSLAQPSSTSSDAESRDLINHVPASRERCESSLAQVSCRLLNLVRDPVSAPSPLAMPDTPPRIRHASPSTVLPPAIVIHRRSRNFGFVIRAIRVFYGNTDVYTLHHLIVGVDPEGSAFQAGLREDDLITHINGQSITGAFHTEVVSMIIQSGPRIKLHVVPLDQSVIRADGPWRPSGKMASNHSRRVQQLHTRKRGMCGVGARHIPVLPVSPTLPVIGQRTTQHMSTDTGTPTTPPYGHRCGTRLSVTMGPTFNASTMCHLSHTTRRSTEKPLIRQLSEKHRQLQASRSRHVIRDLSHPHPSSCSPPVTCISHPSKTNNTDHNLNL